LISSIPRSDGRPGHASSSSLSQYVPLTIALSPPSPSIHPESPSESSMHHVSSTLKSKSRPPSLTFQLATTTSTIATTNAADNQASSERRVSTSDGDFSTTVLAGSQPAGRPYSPSAQSTHLVHLASDPNLPPSSIGAPPRVSLIRRPSLHHRNRSSPVSQLRLRRASSSGLPQIRSTGSLVRFVIFLFFLGFDAA
jgi:hypothetical protein